ncbi:MAG: hypothetical protein JRI55_31345, partial [Deltaproteobacteria bacterium]|nr:hypothetical protein [Deltaproteobacteria bacterium]
MPANESNRFIRALSEALAADPLTEKRLLAPSLRVGYQWLDVVTRRGGAVLNARVSTVRSFAIDLATPTIATFGRALVSGTRKELIIAESFAGIRGGQPGYLAGLDPNPGLIDALVRAIDDLRLAGIRAESLDPGSFEVAEKGEELRWLLRAYEAALDRENLYDFADVIRLASKRAAGLIGPPLAALVLMPADLEPRLRGLERTLWKTLPRRSKRLLDVDLPTDDRGEDGSDAGLLRFVSSPAEAPQPKGDGTAVILRAVGEVNEVREVFRRCIEGGIPFDDVEIVHTDSGTFVPLIHEIAARVAAGSLETLPVTFDEGIPLRSTRPGRALLAWSSWVREGFSQEVLVCAVQEGLFALDLPEGADRGYVGVSEVLRRVPIGWGAEEHLTQIDREIARLEALARVRGARWKSPHFKRDGLTPDSLGELRALRA